MNIIAFIIFFALWLCLKISDGFKAERDQLAAKLKQVEVDSTFVAEQAVSDTDNE